MKGHSFKVLVLCAVILIPFHVAGTEPIYNLVDNGWNGSAISAIGASGSDYYAQSFVANMRTITRFGVVIKQGSSVGEIKLAIAADDGTGRPNYAAPLYKGALKTPTTTATWHFETGLSIPVVQGQKYYVLLDGYDIPGTTGWSWIGLSDAQPIPGEGIIWSNIGGVGAWNTAAGYPLAIRVEGIGGAAAVPGLGLWGIAGLAAALALSALYFLKR